MTGRITSVTAQWALAGRLVGADGGARVGRRPGQRLRAARLRRRRKVASTERVGALRHQRCAGSQLAAQACAAASPGDGNYVLLTDGVTCLTGQALASVP